MAASISKFMGGAVHCKHVLQACFCLETVANVARIVDAECGLLNVASANLPVAQGK